MTAYMLDEGVFVTRVAPDAQESLELSTLDSVNYSGRNYSGRAKR
jgi:hypothetical protein